MMIVKQQLREAGFMPTRQRVLLLQSMRRRTDHPDVETVLTDLREILPSFSTDTVYRTLNAYAERGLIQRLPLPVNRARFDGNVDPHDHFLCHVCGLILDLFPASEAHIINGTPMDRIAQIDSVQQISTGLCRDCVATDSQESRDLLGAKGLPTLTDPNCFHMRGDGYDALKNGEGRSE